MTGRIQNTAKMKKKSRIAILTRPSMEIRTKTHLLESFYLLTIIFYAFELYRIFQACQRLSDRVTFLLFRLRDQICSVWCLTDRE